MRASLKTSVTFTLAALAIGLGVAASATPASAHMPPHSGGGHFGHFGHWGHGGHWGPGFGFGLGLVGLGYEAESCVRYQPVFDSAGEFVGREPVNVCE